MKKIFAAALSVICIVFFALPSCAAVRVACLKGPTGMGLAKLMEDASNGSADYEFQIASSPDALAAAFIRGEADIFALPSNMASILWNRTNGGVRALSVSVTDALSAISSRDDIRTVADLREKTIVSAGRGTSPDHVLRFLLKSNGIDPDKDCTIEWRSEHTEVTSHMLSGERYDAAILPHPFADIAMMRGDHLRKAFSFGDEWQKIGTGSHLVIGVQITSKEFADSSADAVAKFIRDSAASAKFVNENKKEAAALIVKHGIIDSEAIAERSIPNCGIASIVGEEMKQSVSGYLRVLYDADPRSVGGDLPDDGFYSFSITDPSRR